MPGALKVRKIGNSLGVILPKQTLDALNVGEDDELFIVRTADGIRLTPYDPEFAETLEDARSFMDSHRNAFKKLAE